MAGRIFRGGVDGDVDPEIERPEEQALLSEAGEVLLDLMQSQSTARRKAPGDDLVSRLVVAEASVGKSITMKRFHTRGRGKSTRILKPFSRLRIVVREVEEA